MIYREAANRENIAKLCGATVYGDLCIQIWTLNRVDNRKMTSNDKTCVNMME